VRFVRSLCQNFPLLQDQGHSKWRDVELAMPNLGAGWLYYEPTAKEITACVGPKAAVPVPVSVTPSKCSQQAQLLGLC